MRLSHPVLLVEDEAAVRETLAEQLHMHGIEADGVGTAREAEERLAGAPARYDALIVDVGLPDGDGRDLCTRLRRSGVRVPILMLTGRADEGDLVRALDAGADDYLVKPFRLAELLARLRAQLRGYEASADALIQIGPYRFKPAERFLKDGAGRRITLTDKETAILRYLHRAGGRAVSRGELLREVWGYNPSTTTHTLETHIYRLRRKIEPDPARPTLMPVLREGYALAPPTGAVEAPLARTRAA
jgi:DNA-binding response OmpR family regulator